MIFEDNFYRFSTFGRHDSSMQQVSMLDASFTKNGFLVSIIAYHQNVLQYEAFITKIIQLKQNKHKKQKLNSLDGRYVKKQTTTV